MGGVIFFGPQSWGWCCWRRISRLVAGHFLLGRENLFFFFWHGLENGNRNGLSGTVGQEEVSVYLLETKPTIQPGGNKRQTFHLEQHGFPSSPLQWRAILAACTPAPVRWCNGLLRVGENPGLVLVGLGEMWNTASVCWTWVVKGWLWPDSFLKEYGPWSSPTTEILTTTSPVLSPENSHEFSCWPQTTSIHYEVDGELILTLIARKTPLAQEVLMKFWCSKGPVLCFTVLGKARQVYIYI